MGWLDKLFIRRILKRRQNDEEIWRTANGGQRYCFETETNEITGGFGGAFNGEKIGQEWEKEKAEGPKSKNLSPEELTKVLKSVPKRNHKLGRNHFNGEYNTAEQRRNEIRAGRFPKSYFDKGEEEIYSEIEKKLRDGDFKVATERSGENRGYMQFRGRIFQAYKKLDDGTIKPVPTEKVCVVYSNMCGYQAYPIPQEGYDERIKLVR